MEHKGPVGVIGAGSWGTTLANLLADKGFDVNLWVFEKDLFTIIRETGENSFYLPGFRLHERLKACDCLESVVRDCGLILMVVPSHVYRGVVKQMLPHLREDAVIVSATKGIENESLLTMSGIWKELLPPDSRVRVLCISGPSFAKEVMQNIPTAVTLAGDDIETTQEIQQIISTGRFRIYTSLDKIGVEIAGASKNVIAVAAGVSDGLSFGYNTRAALITRGLAETSRLGVKMGAHPLTFAGLAGVGDLLLTCTGDLSRNRTVGFQLGQGKKLDEILGGMRMVAEGVMTAKSIHALARRMEVEMPICEQVYKILYEGKDPLRVVRDLMERDLKHELEFSPKV
ncbi:MAG: NAD(P)-dependent glycerol-3-phosphate dehydrogenase [Desulfobacteraceae bacterium]|nr:NAD(P)-dependent glycerol-3-phosphate dehydrogenase [Desulfobacteraceae bacterium]